VSTPVNSYYISYIGFIKLQPLETPVENYNVTSSITLERTLTTA